MTLVKFFAFGAAGLLASAAMLFTTWCVAHRPADYGWRGRLSIALSYLALGIIALIAAWAGVYRRQNDAAAAAPAEEQTLS